MIDPDVRPRASVYPILVAVCGASLVSALGLRTIDAQAVPQIPDLAAVAPEGGGGGGGEDDPAAGDRDLDGLRDDEELILGTSPDDPDSDNDGLLDGWEVYGYPRHGSIEPLQIYGANPRLMDIFVEIDWMVAAGAEPQRNALIAYQAACDIHRVFRDSRSGIRIHFDLGADIESLIPPERRERDGPDLTRFRFSTDPQKTVPYQDRFPVRPLRGGPSTLLSLYDIYNDPRYFRAERRNIFYYVLVAEQYGLESDGQGFRRGFTDSFADESARRAGLRPAGVQVSVIYRLPEHNLPEAERRFAYSAAILHELGHGFGLGHGGTLRDGRWNDRNNKPNYPSVMNHRYQFWGVDLREGARVMDFSRGLFRDVTESSLFEPVGLGPLPGPHVLENLGVGHIDWNGAPQNLDWNRNGSVDFVPVHEDLDFNGRIDPEKATDHDDWTKFLRDGFSGIGTRAFLGCGLGCGMGNEVVRVPGDFDGDGAGDLVLFGGDRLAVAFRTAGGSLRLSEEAVFSGAVGEWKLSYGDQLLPIDLDGDGADELVAHRRARVAVIDLSPAGRRRRVVWSGDVAAAHEPEAAVEGGPVPVSWVFDRDDLLRSLRLAPGGSGAVMASNERSAAVLRWSKERLLVDWSPAGGLARFAGGSSPTVSPGRFQEGVGGTFFVRGSNVLTEFDRRGEGYLARRVDAEGLIPSSSTDRSPWRLAWTDCLLPLDIDGDGSQEVLIKGAERIGLLREVDGALLLDWSAERAFGPWTMKADDSVHVGDFLAERGGEEVFVSYAADDGQRYWAAIAWSAEAAAPEIVAVAYGGVPDRVGGGVAYPLHGGQRLIPLRLVEGEPLVLLVQDRASWMVARWTVNGFEQVSVHDDAIGSWSIGADDSIITGAARPGAAETVHVRRGDLLAIVELGPTPSVPFIAAYDRDAMRFLPPEVFRRGDANSDGVVDISDSLALLGFLFIGSQKIVCLDAADTDDNGFLEISDAIRLLGHLFLGSGPLPSPGTYRTGTDPTEDSLRCPPE